MKMGKKDRCKYKRIENNLFGVNNYELVTLAEGHS